ncbi:MAG: hypothetical protein AB1451_07455 [Nitrospirota bacterium]
MKQWTTSLCAMAAVLALSVAAYAGMTMVSGEVTKYEVGKTIAVKDTQGMVHALEITKDTKVEGDVKVGANVSVEAEGKTAQIVKAAKVGGEFGG